MILHTNHAHTLGTCAHAPTSPNIPDRAVDSSLQVVVWSQGFVEATSLRADEVEAKHISYLPFVDDTALDQVSRVSGSGEGVSESVSQ